MLFSPCHVVAAGCDAYGLASRTMLNGVSVARRTWAGPRLAQHHGKLSFTGRLDQQGSDLQGNSGWR